MSRFATARPRPSLAAIDQGVRKHPNNVHVCMSIRPGAVLVLAVWLGLATSVLEIGLLFVRRDVFDPAAVTALQLNQHARWMIPISYGMIFGTCGLILAGTACLTRSRQACGRGVLRALFSLVRRPAARRQGLDDDRLFVARGGLHVVGCAVSLGVRSAAEPADQFQLPGTGRPGRNLFQRERRPGKARRAPAAQAGAGSPNVLFIVLDTVRAESLSLYGYKRETSPHLKEFANRGVRFDQARTAAAWTLPAHASMFTGRWPYELSARPDRPLDGTHPTLAEFLRDHGYATAGFAANTYFCSLWYGLGRGFMHYEDVASDSARNPSKLGHGPISGQEDVAF